METELEIAEQDIDRCLQAIVDGELTAVEAAKAKWWTTELAKRVIDNCVQLHGGYGYMNEYKITRNHADARIMTIFGGTTEITKDIIGRNVVAASLTRAIEPTVSWRLSTCTNHLDLN